MSGCAGQAWPCSAQQPGSLDLSFHASQKGENVYQVFMFLAKWEKGCLEDYFPSGKEKAWPSKPRT